MPRHSCGGTSEVYHFSEMFQNERDILAIWQFERRQIDIVEAEMGSTSASSY
jgi:hypothetical protein